MKPDPGRIPNFGSILKHEAKAWFLKHCMILLEGSYMQLEQSLLRSYESSPVSLIWDLVIGLKYLQQKPTPEGSDTA